MKFKINQNHYATRVRCEWSPSCRMIDPRHRIVPLKIAIKMLSILSIEKKLFQCSLFVWMRHLHKYQVFVARSCEIFGSRPAPPTTITKLINQIFYCFANVILMVNVTEIKKSTITWSIILIAKWHEILQRR